MYVVLICRIGSLEIVEHVERAMQLLICRIGSLENPDLRYMQEILSYLPHRQLRNVTSTRS